MSRLIDEFRKATQTTAQPMGFRAARSTATASRMPLIVSLQIGANLKPADCTEGASAVLLRTGKTLPTAKTIQTMVKSLPDIPWGVYLDDYGDKKAVALEGEGCDFVVFSASGRISTTPQEEKIGRILQVESSMDDGLLRAVSNLPVDAVLLSDSLESGGSIVWHELMILQHLARLISRPLIVPVPVDINEEELKALWKAGVDGLLVEVDSSRAVALKDLRRAIDKLPPRSQQKRDRMEPLLPRTGGESGAAPPPDEEEEEEYE